MRANEEYTFAHLLSFFDRSPAVVHVLQQVTPNHPPGPEALLRSEPSKPALSLLRRNAARQSSIGHLLSIPYEALLLREGPHRPSVSAPSPRPRPPESPWAPPRGQG